MKLLLPLVLGAAAAAAAVAAQPQAFDCPTSSCWCGDSFSADQVELRPEIYYRTAFNRVTQANQTLFLDEWLAPSSTPRPGALIIHGGGYSTGPFNGCSHAKNMSSFADVAMALARRGFAVVSIDYRCEGPLRAGDPADLFHPWCRGRAHDRRHHQRRPSEHIRRIQAPARLNPAAAAAHHRPSAPRAHPSWGRRSPTAAAPCTPPAASTPGQATHWNWVAVPCL